MPKHKIIVGKKLHSPHPFVAAARQALQKMEPDKLTQLMPRHIDRLYVAVGKASVPRALLILDALLKALERRKFLVKMEDGFVQVTILDEVFLFGVDERRKQVMPVLNKIQNAQKALNPTLYTGRSYLLTGLLNLKQFSPWGRSPWVILSDNDKHKLEDCLNSFIVKLIHAAMERKAARLERQRQDEEYRRREEERALRAKLLAEENARIAGLKSDVADWEQSRLIRGYIEAVRQKASANGMSLQPEGEFGRWILWAEAIADRLDPLLRANPFREMSA